MALQDPLATPIDVALRRLELCAYAVQEVHTEVQEPTDPEHKADLLLATENLTYEVLDLLQTVKYYAWGPDHEKELGLREDEEL
jgi:hypothetical protein